MTPLRFGFRPLLATLLAVVAGALVPSVASATTTVSQSGNTFLIVGDDAPSALVRPYSSYVGFRLQDTLGGAVIPGAGCVAITASDVECGPFAGGDTYGKNYAITAKLGGGDDNYKYAIFDGPQTVDGEGGNDSIEVSNGSDTVQGGPGDDKLSGQLGDDNLDGGIGNDTVEGSEGNDTVAGGPGVDQLLGDGTSYYEDGNDTILARDGEGDSVNCGGGADRAEVDTVDVTSACESIDAPVVNNGGGGGGGSNGGGGAVPAALSVAGGVTKKPSPKSLSQGKKVQATLTANATCSGVIAIAVSKGEAKRLHLGKKAMTIGTGEAATLTAGVSTTLTAAVASKYRSKLKNTSKLKATVVIACVDAANRQFTAGEAVTLKK